MKKYLLSLIVMSMLMSCVSDREDSLGVTASALSFASATIPVSATRSAAVTNGSLVMYRSTDNGYTARSNVKYAYNSSSSSWTASDPVLLSSANAGIYGYYPYGVSCITDETDPASVTLTSQKYDPDQDFCYLPKTFLNNSSSNITLNMKRAYAKITFIITHESSYSGACKITNINISHSGIKKSGTLNMITGAYDAGTLGPVSYDPGITTIAPDSSKTTSLLMVPVTTELTGNVTLSFTVDGVVKTATLDASSNNMKYLASGNNYKASVTIRTSTILKIDNPVTVEDWNILDMGFIGKVTTYYPESNCYMVAPGDSVFIPVSRAYKKPNVKDWGTTWTAQLLWTENPNPLSSTGTIQSVTAKIESNFIIVKAGSKVGNAVVCMKNSSGTILWSWHIWVTGYVPNVNAISVNGLVWMDRNLGATSITPGDPRTKGLYYQWGRKDPFPASTTFSSTTDPDTYNGLGTKVAIGKAYAPAGPNIELSITNPYTFYCNTGSPDDWYSNNGNYNNYLWNSSTNKKTCYDPCPAGWRVPVAGCWSFLNTSNSVWASYGYTYNSSASYYYPAAGVRTSGDGKLAVQGTAIAIATASNISNGGQARLLASNGSILTNNNTGKATAGSVRCVKE